MNKFEVGKKYKGKSSGIIMEVLFVGNEYAFCRQANGLEIMIDLSSRSSVTEYKEPRTYKKWHVVYVHDNGKIFLGNQSFDLQEEAKSELKKNYILSKAIGVTLVDWTEE